MAEDFKSVMKNMVIWIGHPNWHNLSMVKPENLL